MALRPVTNGANGTYRFSAVAGGTAAAAMPFSGAAATIVGVYIDTYPAQLAFGTSAVATPTAVGVLPCNATSVFPKDVFFLLELASTDTHVSARGVGGDATVTLTFFAG